MGRSWPTCHNIGELHIRSTHSLYVQGMVPSSADVRLFMIRRRSDSNQTPINATKNVWDPGSVSVKFAPGQPSHVEMS
jgi:hypothetical protein